MAIYDNDILFKIYINILRLFKSMQVTQPTVVQWALAYPILWLHLETKQSIHAFTLDYFIWIEYSTQALPETNLPAGTTVEKFRWNLFPRLRSSTDKNLAADLKKVFYETGFWRSRSAAAVIKILNPRAEGELSKSWYHPLFECQWFCNKQTNEWTTE